MSCWVYWHVQEQKGHLMLDLLLFRDVFGQILFEGLDTFLATLTLLFWYMEKSATSRSGCHIVVDINKPDMYIGD